MAKDLTALASDLEKLAKLIETAASKTAVDTAMVVVRQLAYETPVDTSKAISNWITTLDKASDAMINPHFPGERGSTYSASAAETIASAERALAGKKPGQPIYITNNQPYIKRLNEGSSQQQPRGGFVQAAVLLARKKMKFSLKSTAR